jgi:hypothetical protein
VRVPLSCSTTGAAFSASPSETGESRPQWSGKAVFWDNTCMATLTRLRRNSIGETRLARLGRNFYWGLNFPQNSPPSAQLVDREESISRRLDEVLHTLSWQGTSIFEVEFRLKITTFQTIMEPRDLRPSHRHVTRHRIPGILIHPLRAAEGPVEVWWNKRQFGVGTC